MPGFITPGTPLCNEEGGDILKGPRNLDGVKRLLTESGYSGQAVTCMAAQDIPEFKPWGDLTVDLPTRLGMKLDYVAVDWGTVVQRRAQKSPPGQGGWQMYHSALTGVECIDGTNKWVRANGERASFGWPNIPQVEAEVAAWFDATSLE